ncbi:LysR family transcriptional regulator [Pararobbsia silviterrae]|uniref:LysR family transcriptional regulator n=1 Tax=Pararobbsia silviterrae TaxID=1792498 RepID=A0A494YA46_9BURK|nr:LysR family transcriptional regulator [Pararobbsia silviterrae]
MFDLSTLAIFRAVVHERGVTRAATRLRRAPSNVTTRIKQLERALGVTLFARDGRSVALTPAGKDLLPYAERLLALAREAREALSAARPHGLLRLGAIESFAAGILPDLLTRYRALCPDVSIDLAIEPADTLLARLRRFEIDAALVARPDDPADIGPYASDVVGIDDIVLVTAVGRAPVTHPRELGAARMVCLGQGDACGLRHRAQAWLASGGVRPRHVIEVGSNHALFAWVATGAAYGFVPRSTLSRAAHSNAVMWHPIGPIGAVDTLLVWREGHCPRALDVLRSMLVAGDA